MSGAAPHIAIVGGGTAGWLAAHMLRRLSRETDTACRLTVIEDPDIPTIGVGEGTTSVFRDVLLDLGFDEFEFMRETGATIKYGIRHIGWGARSSGPGSDYLGPIDDPHQLTPDPTGQGRPWLHYSAIAAGQQAIRSHVFTPLMTGQRAPWAQQGGKLMPVSPYHHAYHFDQAKVGAFLRRKADGIEQVSSKVTGIEKDSGSGLVTALKCQGQPDIAVDFVFDCTGFRRALMTELGVSWHHYGSLLPLNRAMPFWLEHSEAGEIAPYTTARALRSGWMWQIPTADRLGCGYVYSDAHTTPEEAQREIEQVLGCRITPRADLAFKEGRLKQPWSGNCIALGLSQCFLEPLEATSIHGTVVQLLLLGAGGFLAHLGGDISDLRENYNQAVNQQIDDFAQFINLHYAGGRRDSAFWQDMTECGISDLNRDRLELWSNEAPIRAHFPTLPAGLPHVQEQLYMPVLDGLGLLPKAPCKAALTRTAGMARAARLQREDNREQFRKISAKALGHREFLTRLNSGDLPC
ncbi:tryptophan 7-halogenase [Roseibium sp. SCP14]|uniref:tryptophan 7-halogenase n=1 Tax=Roseibium sp. SCP14 TaxID=3141375 RepID=UPI0033361763